MGKGGFMSQILGADPVAHQLLEASDVARRLECSAASVRNYARAGLLVTAATTPRGGRLFRPEDVEEFRRRRRVGEGNGPV
jgi:DNA-binding transcriptional MerR regulator